jgi:DNA repair protein RadD
MSAASDLRDYQTAGLDAVRASIARGNRRVLMVSPTGSGKTVTAREMIRGAVAQGGAVLFLAHRKELIDQASKHLDHVGVDHGVLMSTHPRSAPWAPVQVASIPTLARRLDNLPRATLVVVDEAHHARATTYSEVLAHYPDAPVVGLTATPWRLDNKGLGELFQDVVVVTSPRQLISEGYLVPYTGFAYDVPDLRGVKKSHGEFDQHSLELVMTRQKLAGNVVDRWLQHCAGKRTAVFAVSVAHSQQLVERFRAAGAAAEHLDGTTPRLEREAILARLAAGETQVVCNVNVLTEGYDCPGLEVCVLARPTLSVALYLQMVGRAMRPACLGCFRYLHPKADHCESCGSVEVKRLARIHDHAGCIMKHGMPDAERDYSLAADPKTRPAAEAPRMCKRCFAWYGGSPKECPSCGAPLGTAGAGVFGQPEEVTHGVEEIPLEQLQGLQDERRQFLQEQTRRALDEGKKPGWAAYRYKERYGEWPPGEWWGRNRVPMSAERIAELNRRVAGRLR